MSIAKGRDDLWVGVKCQANPEIAGSPRNAFRCSPGQEHTAEVASRIGTGACRLPTRTKRRMPWCVPGSETVGAKFHCREGNSPDHRLRSPSLN